MTSLLSSVTEGSTYRHHQNHDHHHHHRRHHHTYVLDLEAPGQTSLPEGGAGDRLA
jgi:hypothetical protein